MIISSRKIIDIAFSEPVAISAACLAVFALRATLAPSEDAATSDTFRLAADDQPRHLWDAASHVAMWPKPLFYGGELRDGAITVRAQDVETDSYERLSFEARLRGEHGGLLSFLENRYATNAGELRVAFWGAGLLLRVPLAAVHEWEHSYSLQEPWCAGADYCNSSYPVVQGARREDLTGCVGFVSIGRS